MSGYGKGIDEDIAIDEIESLMLERHGCWK